MRTFTAFGLFIGLMSTAIAQDASKFEFKYEEKKPFFQQMETVVTQTIKVQGGTDQPQKHSQTFLFAWIPEKYDKATNTWTLKQKIEGIKMSIDIAGNAINYDSTDSKTAATTNSGLSEFYKSLIGTEFTVTIKNGIVEKVDGKDDLLKKLSSANSQMEPLLKKILSDDALKQMTDPTFGINPGKEIKKDETWERKQSVNLGPIGIYDITYKYKYLGKDATNKEIDRVEVNNDLVYKAPSESTEGLLFRIKGGELKSHEPKPGSFLYDPKTGKVVEYQISAKLKGQLNVTVGSTDTTVDLYQEQTTKVTTQDKSFVVGSTVVVPAPTATPAPATPAPTATPAPATPAPTATPAPATTQAPAAPATPAPETKKEPEKKN